MQENNENSGRPVTNPRRNESSAESSSIFSRLIKAVTDQINPAEKMPEFGNEALEIETGGAEPNSRISRSFSTSENHLKAFFSRKSFTVAVGTKQFWKPDNSTRVCYACYESFTAIRGGHHCGICGEIFCSKCCDRIVYGKLFGFTGEMRSCEFCCKVLVSVLSAGRVNVQSAISIEELKTNLKLVNFDHSKFLRDSSKENADLPSLSESQTKSRDLFEEKYATQTSNAGAASNDTDLQERLFFEKSVMYQNKADLLKLRTRMVYGPNPLPLSTHWHHLRSVSNCFTGEILVDWLMNTGIASKRDCAFCIGCALVISEYIMSASYPDRKFSPDFSIYVICPLDNIDEPERPKPRELPNWEIPNSNHSGNSAAKCGLKTNESKKESESESDEEVEPPAEIKRTPVPNRKEFKMANESNVLESIASLCPSYFLNEPARLRSPSKCSELTKKEEKSNATTSASLKGKTESELLEHMISSGIKPSALDDMPEDAVFFESVEDSKKFKYSARTIWDIYEKRLLTQLVEHADISEEWVDIIRNLAHRVCKIVKLDVRRDESQADIRRYVKFKKVLSENYRGAKVVNGIVITKNVTLNGMKTSFERPQILMIEKSLVYKKAGIKYMTLAMLKDEADPYLKNVCDKIIALKPDIVMVEHIIPYKSHMQLLKAGVTVIASIKKSVMERVARATEAQTVTSIDTQLSHPVFGTCGSFRLKPYLNCGHQKKKMLMFFNKCPANLDCTVILKGPNYDELHHAKRIAYLMLLAVHNYIRETSFLREISASLFPILRSRIVDVEEQTTQPTSEPIDAADTDRGQTREPDSVEEDTTMTHFDSQVAPIADMQEAAEGVESTANFSDPLQSFLEMVDRLPERRNSVDEYDFASALSKVALSISPYYAYHVPYLESAAGKKSQLIKYFTPKPYTSHLFEAVKPKKVVKRPPPLPSWHIKCSNKPPHPFVTATITKSVDDEKTADLVADYRARGGDVELAYCDGNDDDPVYQRSIENTKEKKTTYTTPLTNGNEVDALHPFNHQSISYLYCCFSEDFMNNSTFCTEPCYLQMEFYGKNDITLGKFLDQFCFNEAFSCRNTDCSALAKSHVRKFSHANGCVDVMLRVVDMFPSSVVTNDNNIQMWSWCKICNKKPNYEVHVMSDEVYNYSFAKYLELLFYEDEINKRGEKACPHSLHQENFHYFMKKSNLAVIRYSPVDLRELVIPPTSLAYTLYPIKYSTLVDQLKLLTTQGGNVFLAGFEQQQKLADEAGASLETKIKSLVADQVQHRLLFKDKQTSIQKQLSDESFSSRIIAGNYNDDDVLRLYQIWDEIINAKILLMKVVTDWNVKIQEFMQIKKKEEKSKHPLTPSRSNSDSTAGHPSEDLRPLEGTRAAEPRQDSHARNTDERRTPERKKNEVIPEPDFDHLSEEVEAFAREQKNFLKVVSRLVSPNRPNPSSPSVRSPPASSVLKLLHSSSSAGYFANTCSEKDVGGGLEKSDVDYPSMNRSRLTEKLDNIAQSSAEVIANAAAAAAKPAPDFGLMDPPELPTDTTDSPERKSAVKQLISSLWNSSFESLIRSPFSSWEHYGVLPHVKVPIAIIEEEPSSFIAHSLASKMYQSKLALLQRKLSDSNANLDPFDSLGEVAGIPLPASIETITPHIELQFKDHNTDFYIKIDFAEHFRKLRSLAFPCGEETYIRSLARCIPWEAKGGKSRSAFCKTTDDRFVLKGLSKREALSFIHFGPYYLQYITQCQKEQQPTVLAKIFGVYSITYKNNTTGKTNRITFLVMENLFYRRKISHKFDLKGSIRNRMVNISTDPESEIVLMDQNLVKMACSSPLFLREHSKEVLKRAVDSDTDFLCKQAVIDYSLLVGVDEEQNELVVGIIDFIRGYTFDARLETLFKQSINPSQTPTVVPPDTYRYRFCKAMNQYFLCMPDRWYHFGTKYQSGKM